MRQAPSRRCRQEELQPTLPVPVKAHRGQPGEVFVAVLAKVGAEIEDRTRQGAALTEQHRDEESPHATVTVEERVDSLELGVNEPAAYQERESAVALRLMYEMLECRESVTHFLGWWGMNEAV